MAGQDGGADSVAAFAGAVVVSASTVVGAGAAGAPIAVLAAAPGAEEAPIAVPASAPEADEEAATGAAFAGNQNRGLTLRPPSSLRLSEALSETRLGLGERNAFSAAVSVSRPSPRPAQAQGALRRAAAAPCPCSDGCDAS